MASEAFCMQMWAHPRYGDRADVGLVRQVEDSIDAMQVSSVTQLKTPSSPGSVICIADLGTAHLIAIPHAPEDAVAGYPASLLLIPKIVLHSSESLSLLMGALLIRRRRASFPNFQPSRGRKR